MISFLLFFLPFIFLLPLCLLPFLLLLPVITTELHANPAQAGFLYYQVSQSLNRRACFIINQDKKMLFSTFIFLTLEKNLFLRLVILRILVEKVTILPLPFLIMLRSCSPVFSSVFSSLNRNRALAITASFSDCICGWPFIPFAHSSSPGAVLCMNVPEHARFQKPLPGLCKLEHIQ